MLSSLMVILNTFIDFNIKCKNGSDSIPEIILKIFLSFYTSFRKFNSFNIQVGSHKAAFLG